MCCSCKYFECRCYVCATPLSAFRFSHPIPSHTTQTRRVPRWWKFFVEEKQISVEMKYKNIHFKQAEHTAATQWHWMTAMTVIHDRKPNYGYVELNLKPDSLNPFIDFQFKLVKMPNKKLVQSSFLNRNDLQPQFQFCVSILLKFTIIGCKTDFRLLIASKFEMESIFRTYFEICLPRLNWQFWRKADRNH